jgi:hypothetical protein
MTGWFAATFVSVAFALGGAIAEAAAPAGPADKAASPAPAEKAAPAAPPEQPGLSPTPAPVDATSLPPPAPTPAPEPTPLPQSPLVTEPPGAGDRATSMSRWSSPDAILDQLTVTDIAIAIFALAVLIFAFRTSSASAHLRAHAQRQAEDGRRAVEASEKAADSAERSAHAAEQALASMRDTAERQLRPYVTVRQFLQAPAKDERQNVHGWLLQVAWQNSGTTPTRGFRYWAMLREFDGAIPDDFDFKPAGLKDFAGGELGSNGTVNSPPLFVTQQQISRIQDGSRKALLLGQADYSDMAGTVKRETRFCVELVLVNDPSGANGSPFSFSYYPKYNSIT